MRKAENVKKIFNKIPLENFKKRRKKFSPKSLSFLKKKMKKVSRNETKMPQTKCLYKILHAQLMSGVTVFKLH